MGQGAAGFAEDRRRSERVPARVEVRFSEASEAARALRAYSLNFSVGGLCLKTRRHYEVGATLKLSIRIGGETYEMTGAVAWVRDGAVGIRFEGLSDQDRARLEALVAAFKRPTPVTS